MTAFLPSGKTALVRRLSRFWKVEAANMVAIPGLAILAVEKSGSTIRFPLIVAMAAAWFLLVIGTVALRIKLKMAMRDRSFGQRWLPWLSKAQWPALAIAVAEPWRRQDLKFG